MQVTNQEVVLTIRKVNPLYTIIYFMVPVLVFAVAAVIGINYDLIGTAAVVSFFGPVVFAVLWYWIGNPLLFKLRRKKFERELDAMGFVRSYTFYGSSTITVIDEQNANVALLFRFHPFRPYIFPAARVKKAWTDDGRMGKGFKEGSSQVSFIMAIGRKKIRVYTFRSNRRFTMNSDQILTGISKADVVVEILKNAHDRSLEYGHNEKYE